MVISAALEEVLDAAMLLVQDGADVAGYINDQNDIGMNLKELQLYMDRIYSMLVDSSTI